MDGEGGKDRIENHLRSISSASSADRSSTCFGAFPKKASIGKIFQDEQFLKILDGQVVLPPVRSLDMLPSRWSVTCMGLLAFASGCSQGTEKPAEFYPVRGPNGFITYRS